MEGQGLADVQVPVIPIMAAGKFPVEVWDVQFLKFAMEIAVAAQQGVFGATIDQNSWEAPVAPSGAPDQRDRVVPCADEAPAEDPLQLREELRRISAKDRIPPRLPGTQVEVHAQQRARMAVHRTEPLRIAQPHPQGAISAHREAADRARVARRLHRERAFDEARQFLTAMPGVIRTLLVVGVESPVAVRQHHDERQFSHIPFQP